MGEGEAVDGFALEAFVGVEVLACSIKIAVAHQPLDRDNVAAALKQTRRVRVAEFVKRGVRNFGGAGNLFEAPQDMRHALAFLVRWPAASARRPG